MTSVRGASGGVRVGETGAVGGAVSGMGGGYEARLRECHAWRNDGVEFEMKKSRANGAVGRTRKRKAVHLPIVVEQDEDGVFIVSAPTVPGCRSYGYTLEEAMANIAEAARACLADLPRQSPRTMFLGIRDLQLVA